MPAPPIAAPLLWLQNLEQAKAMHAAMIAELGAASTSLAWRAIVHPGPSALGAARWLRSQGGDIHVSAADPWAALDHTSCLWGVPDDDCVIVAHLIGVPVRLFGADGQAVAPSASCYRASIFLQDIVCNTRYFDCCTGQSVTVVEAIDQLAMWRGLIDQNRAIVSASGIAGWKRREVRSFLWAGDAAPLPMYRRSNQALRHARQAAGAIAVWPSRVPQRLFDDAMRAQVPVHQIEDGFIRSVGLGSGLHPPQSIVVDEQGIYYDPTSPSALETILETAEFSPLLVDRAAALIDTIVATGISKYAAGRDVLPALPGGRRTVLVTGQVEDDRSVLLGGGEVTGNLDLLRRARATEPDAFLIFKPHPDVQAGHRTGAIAEADARALADLVVYDASMAALLDSVDAVHVWTSLAGFEALLRGRDVIVHGQPFFAGWGLTQDLGPPIARRTRRVSLPALVAAVLILYPRYLDPVTNLLCTPELLITRMVQANARHHTLLTRARAFQGRISRWLR